MNNNNNIEDTSVDFGLIVPHIRTPGDYILLIIKLREKIQIEDAITLVTDKKEFGNIRKNWETTYNVTIVSRFEFSQICRFDKNTDKTKHVIYDIDNFNESHISQIAVMSLVTRYDILRNAEKPLISILASSKDPSRFLKSFITEPIFHDTIVGGSYICHPFKLDDSQGNKRTFYPNTLTKVLRNCNQLLSTIGLLENTSSGKLFRRHR